jgi:hypothetical protein
VGFISTGGGLYLYGSIVPLTVRGKAVALVYGEGEYVGQEMVQVQVGVSSRTRNAVAVTVFGYVPRSQSSSHSWTSRSKKLPGVKPFLGEGLPRGGLEIPGHTTKLLAGVLSLASYPDDGIDVALAVGKYNFLRPIPEVDRSFLDSTPS